METKEEIFKHSIPIQIRFNDIDGLGHVNNTIYFSYFDLGKVEYFESLKASIVDWTEGIVVIAHIDTDFLSPVYYKESVIVETKVRKVGTKSITLFQQLRNVKTREIKCCCTTVMVAYNPILQSAMEIPEVWKKAIHKLDGCLD